jgi:N-dimethylarginine dimethylaminohydrolase
MLLFVQACFPCREISMPIAPPTSNVAPDDSPLASHAVPAVSARARFVVSALACAPRACGADEPRDACRYRVAWSINPHMRIGAVEPDRAMRQHDALVRLLAQLGAIVDTVPFVHGAYDSVFMKDSAVLVHRAGCDRALLSRPLHDERQREQPARREALEASGFVVDVAPDAPFEGGDVVVRPGDRGAFFGHGVRSSIDAAPALERFLGAPVVPLCLRDPNLFHLDMALASLHDGTILLCEEALTPDSVRAVVHAAEAQASDVVRVPYDEARRFALNVIEVGSDVVLGAHAPRLEAILRARHVTTHVASLSEFHHAGGSAACLVARVHGCEAARARANGETYSSDTSSATAAIRSTAA